MTPAQPNQSIITGFIVLQEVVTANVPLGSRELARRLDLEHSKVNRVLGTLVHTGMLQQDASRKYSVGPGIHALSAQSLHASGLIPASLDPLSELQKLGATVALGVVWRESVVYLLHADPHMDLASTAGAHETFPVRESVIGMALGATEAVVRWDRTEANQVAWAAAIGTPRVAAIAAVYPSDNAYARNTEGMNATVAATARRIEANLRSGTRPGAKDGGAREAGVMPEPAVRTTPGGRK
ncbi:MAG: hypothetical protein EA383_00540 [Spirochaetaceae bacterium]|nr:MAG: hypothetical protein EA383_00540 [Spirochaetaceae bacterium]